MKRIKWTQRKIVLFSFLSLGGLLFILWLSLFVPFSRSINKSFLESEAFQVAKEYIRLDSILISQIGQIEGFGTQIGGSYNPKGHANFQFRVYGERGNERVRCRLSIEEEGTWRVVSLEY